MGAVAAMSAILDELKRVGAVLVSRKKHQKWRLPNGRVFTMSQTPSDWRAELNQLSDLRKLLKNER